MPYFPEAPALQTYRLQNSAAYRPVCDLSLHVFTPSAQFCDVTGRSLEPAHTRSSHLHRVHLLGR